MSGLAISSRRINTKRTVVVALVSLCSVTILYGLIYMVAGLAPFGDKSLTYRDGNFQYLDLLMYYKDVLAGNDSINYTLGKSLGGSNFAVFTYYLASPVTLLVALFDKSDMATCFNLMFLIKASLAACFAAIFIDLRFNANKTIAEASFVTVMLSVSYAMSQYMISQSSNIMWLDGVIMLPLMALGVSRAIDRKPLCLILSVCASLTFNWYTGVINCFFTVFWFFAEWFISGGKNLIKSMFRYALAMLCGVLMSGVILVPSLAMLAGRTHGTTDLSDVFTLGFNGNPVASIANYGPGLISLEGTVSLYAGCFVLVGVLLFFYCSKASLRSKIIAGVMLLFAVLMFSWGPLVFLFSILRHVESFWYRYSYLGVFVLIFIAAQFYTSGIKVPVKKSAVPILGFAIVMVILNSIGCCKTQSQLWNYEWSLITGITNVGNVIGIVFQLVVVLVSSFMVILYLNDNKSGSKRGIKVTFCAIAISIEFILNALLLIQLYSVYNKSEVESYASRESSIVSYCSSLESEDSTARIVQTSNRTHTGLNLTAEYNEGLAYGFNSISSFVSAPEEEQGMFLANLGYPFASDTITITRASVIAADSLVGVKYILSEYDIPYTSQLTNNECGKNVYLNTYCLPMAFKTTFDLSDDIGNTNPFEYTNDVYSELTGSGNPVYIQAESEVKTAVESTTYTIDIPDGNYVLYGNIELSSGESVVLDVNGVYQTDYNCFLAPSVFMIPISENSAEVTINSSDVSSAQFYLLDTDALMEAKQRVEDNAVNCSYKGDGSFEINADNAYKGEKLVLMIPYDDGFTVRNNGSVIESKAYLGAYQVIELQDGDNNITIDYQVPNIRLGLTVSLIGVIGAGMTVAVCLRRKRRDNKTTVT